MSETEESGDQHEHGGILAEGGQQLQAGALSSNPHTWKLVKILKKVINLEGACVNIDMFLLTIVLDSGQECITMKSSKRSKPAQHYQQRRPGYIRHRRGKTTACTVCKSASPVDVSIG